MIFNYAHWIPGLIVIGLSFIGGLGAALWLTRNDHGDTDLDTQMADLDEQKDHLISLLKDLDEQKDRMDPEAYASQKTEYEQKAADVLRKRDLFQKELSSNEGVSKKQVTEDQSPALSYFAARPVLRKSLWAGATVLSMGALVTLAINQGTPDREQPVQPGSQRMRAPHQPMVGQGDQKRQAELMADPLLKRALTLLGQNPENLEALNAAAESLLRQNALKDAKQFIEKALLIAPSHPHTLANFAHSLTLRGKPVKALKHLKNVLTAQPDMALALYYQGVAASKQGEAELMKTSLEAYLKTAPDGADKVRAEKLLGN